MASNVSREKLLFYAAAGGLGGLAAWGVQESVAGIRYYFLRDAAQGVIIGLFIGAFLASIEALSVGQWRQAMRGLKSGAIFGAIGGALGGLCYQTLTTSFPQFFGRAIAIIVLGALIGFFIGLVGELLKRGWLMVIRSQSRNAREGREYPLTKPVTIIGRAEESDIGLFGDQAVLAHHAIIRREGRDFVVSGAGGGQVLVNRRPVAGRQALRSGDRVEVGGTLFIFRERAQAAQG